jgi:hypothetical protein
MVVLVCRLCRRDCPSGESRLLSDLCGECADKIEEHTINAVRQLRGQEKQAALDVPGVQEPNAGAIGETLSLKPGAGSALEALTRRLGIPTCSGCKQRKEAMNTVDLNGTAWEVLKGLTEGFFAPEKVLNEKDYVEGKKGGT